MTTVAALNALSVADAADVLRRCCGATRWVERMVAARPFRDRAAVLRTGDETWATMERADILEAFTHHPRIGENVDELRRKFATTASWSAGEQASVSDAGEATLQALAEGNRAYFERFGFIFIVCATGKTAPEMLGLLNERLGNPPDRELEIAANEQARILRLRLEKLGLE